MLLDLGTIALSVNILPSIVVRAQNPLPHRTFLLWMIVASWGFLLVSAFMCRTAMAGAIISNVKLAQWSEKIASAHSATAKWIHFMKMSRIMHTATELPFKDEGKEAIKQLVEEARKAADTANNENLQNILTDPYHKIPKHLRPNALASHLMLVGFILMCIAATKFVAFS